MWQHPTKYVQKQVDKSSFTMLASRELYNQQDGITKIDSVKLSVLPTLLLIQTVDAVSKVVDRKLC
jgi:hypothetical protein